MTKLDHYSQWRHHDATEPYDDGYVKAECGHRVDEEDLKMCTQCGLEGCRKCVDFCSDDTCTKRVCSGCHDKDLKCPECSNALAVVPSTITPSDYD